MWSFKKVSVILILICCSSLAMIGCSPNDVARNKSSYNLEGFDIKQVNDDNDEQSNGDNDNDSNKDTKEDSENNE